MPKFYGQNKKRIDPRYFLNETIEDLEELDESIYECGVCSKKETHYATICRDRKIYKCIKDDDGNWHPPEDCGCGG